ncbi:MAG: rhodanese-like domain-containing protein [Pseudomonadota bacterium]
MNVKLFGIKNITTLIASTIIICTFSINGLAGEVNLTKEIDFIEVKSASSIIKVERNQDTNAVISGDFAKTSRPCPPFCAQPIKVADGVKTIGEVELAQFMNSKMKDGRGILVDARTPDWHIKGTIPGSINIPYTDVNTALGADELTVEDSMEVFGVKKTDDDKWDFSKAKILVLWCNGPWCGQSPAAIKGLLSQG